MHFNYELLANILSWRDRPYSNIILQNAQRCTCISILDIANSTLSCFSSRTRTRDIFFFYTQKGREGATSICDLVFSSIYDGSACIRASRSMGPKTVPRLFPFGFYKTTSYHRISPSSANAMRDHLSLTRIATNRIQIHLRRARSHRPGLLSVDASKGPMADEADKGTKAGDDESSALKGGKKEEEEEKVVLPPPPEKPLPGDCCGSGCVRCVWDIYYDELEDYNKLVSEIKSKSDSASK